MTDSISPMTFVGSQIIWHIRKSSDIFSRNFLCLRPRRVKCFLSWNIFPALICSELLKPWIGFHILGLQTSQWIWFLVLTSAFQANLRSNIPCFHVPNSLSILYIWNCSSILRALLTWNILRSLWLVIVVTKALRICDNFRHKIHVTAVGLLFPRSNWLDAALLNSDWLYSERSKTNFLAFLSDDFHIIGMGCKSVLICKCYRGMPLKSTWEQSRKIPNFLRVGGSCVTSLSKTYNFGQGCEWNQELGIGEEEFKMRNNLLQSHKFSL